MRKIIFVAVVTFCVPLLGACGSETSSQTPIQPPPLPVIGGLPPRVDPSTVSVSPAQHNPQLKGRITLTSDRDGDAEVYVMNADGSNVKRLTKNEGQDCCPAWSLDGRKIAFLSRRDPDSKGGTEIYVMNDDGSNLKRLTNSPGLDDCPAWSPDSKKIAFLSDRSGKRQIYVMDADGTAIGRVTNTDVNEACPSWSPDGKKVAFESYRDGYQQIYIMNADGTDPIRLRTAAARDGRGARDTSPIYSRDGSIAFVSDEERVTEPIWNLYVMHPDGGLRRLTTKANIEHSIAWSPDGTNIAFSWNRDGNNEIYVIALDGQSLTRLTNHPADDSTPAWGP